MNDLKFHSFDEKSAKGSRKVRERFAKGDCPGPNPGPKWASSFCNVATSKAFQRMGAKPMSSPEVKRPHRNTDLPNAIDSVDWNRLITHSRNVTRAALKTDRQ